MRPILLLLAFLLPQLTIAQPKSNNNTVAYMNEVPPGLTPKIFADTVVSRGDQYEYGSIFSVSGTEFYFAVFESGKSDIRFMEVVNGKWTKPKALLSHKIYSYNDPFLSPNGDSLFFISDRPLNSNSSDKKDYDIWYVKRSKNGWSAPINAGPAINSDANEYYISFTASGTMYYSSNRNASDTLKMDYDLYTSRVKHGAFQQPVKLGDQVNTKHYEADVFVAPNESFIIFCAVLPDGYGKGDLYISFKNTDGTWTKAKNMGQSINTAGHELCPFVSPDGKYFFYTGDEGIYWVDSSVINQLRE